MNKLKSLIALTILAIITFPAFSQVTMKAVVEHFTNTNCSICANKNPGFYSNLSGQQDVLHLAVHPSSPYPACLLYQQNATANDARTNYYGVYGATPRLVINGDVLAANVNYSDPNIFTPYTGQTSPASIRIIQEKFATDSIRSTIIVKTEAANTLGSLSLFVALAEDTVTYTGGNGEPVHYDVFRKALTSPVGNALALPGTVGDSLVFTFSSMTDPVWDFSRIYTMAILQQNMNKELVQADAVPASLNSMTTGINSPEDPLGLSIYPNPAADIIAVSVKEPRGMVVRIFSIDGKELDKVETDLRMTEIDLSSYPAGQYLIRVESGKRVSTGTFTKK